METLSAQSVDRSELKQLDDVVANLAPGSHLKAALDFVASSMRRGVAVTLGEMDEQLSPALAAKMLGMSRPHLYKLLDAGELPSSRVGRDRRIRLADLTEYMRTHGAQRAELAERFAHASRDRESLLGVLSGGESAT